MAPSALTAASSAGTTGKTAWAATSSTSSTLLSAETSHSGMRRETGVTAERDSAPAQEIFQDSASRTMRQDCFCSVNRKPLTDSKHVKSLLNYLHSSLKIVPSYTWMSETVRTIPTALDSGGARGAIPATRFVAGTTKNGTTNPYLGVFPKCALS